jgi:hypothetical protein
MYTHNTDTAEVNNSCAALQDATQYFNCMVCACITIVYIIRTSQVHLRQELHIDDDLVATIQNIFHLYVIQVEDCLEPITMWGRKFSADTVH